MKDTVGVLGAERNNLLSLSQILTDELGVCLGARIGK